MRSALLLFAAGWAVVSTTFTLFGQDSKIERGKYLVEEVGRCQECHTPKTEAGEFDKSRWMKGATLVGVPSTPVADWHQKSPDLTSTSDALDEMGPGRVLEVSANGENPRGGTAGPPMPAYMLKAEDADAIATYLKSLP